MFVLAAIFAILGAFFNALASLLQRRSSTKAPKDSLFSMRLIRYLIKHPLWLLGITSQLLAFASEAIALNNGELSFVEPVMTAELIFLLTLMYFVYHLKLGVREWSGGIATVLGLSGFLIAANPSQGAVNHNVFLWGIIGGIICILIGISIFISHFFDKPLRAATLGFAAGSAFTLTEALTKLSVQELDKGLAALFTNWAVYALLVVGVSSMILLQNAYSAGPLSTSQPALLITGTLGAVVLGVFLFNDVIRHDAFSLAAEVASVLVLGVGVVLLSDSKILTKSRKVSGGVGFKT